MKILIFNWRDMHHPLSGGAEISLFEHAKYWKKMGADVTWFSSNFPGAKKREIIDDIEVIRKGSHFTVHLWAFFYYLAGKFSKTDIIIDCFHFLPFFTPFYIQKEKNIALINEVAGTVWFANLPKLFAFIGYILEPYFFSFYDNVTFITSSQSTKDELKKIGVKSTDIEIIHHGINRVNISSKIKKEKTPTLVFLGRISEDKGIDDVFNTYLEIKKTGNDLKLWIIGKEEKQGMFKKLLKKHHAHTFKKDIIYFGYVSEIKKFELLKRAWILIHPSQKEGWGLNVIEAASQGTPTVGYNVEGLRDSVKSGKTGILVDSKNSALLSKAILSIIVDKSKNMYRQLSSNAITWSKRFDWSISTKQSWKLICKVYESQKQNP